MRNLSKVVWSEGMHLAQHHFQAQSRYFEDSIQFALSSLFVQPYGLAGCHLDGEALRNGTVALIHARGVMPDGLAFNVPESDAPPPPREIRDLFSPTQESHVVMLAIPAYRHDGANTAVDEPANGHGPRYTATASLMPDETTGRDERPVSVGRKNLRLLLDSEVTDAQVALPLARVRRDGRGRFIYDPDYIPPLLQIGASEALVEMLRRLVEILDAKSDALAVERQGRALANYASQEVAGFWLRHAVDSSLAPLRHHLQTRRTRPEELYTELARLAGALCTFSLDAHPRDLPAYDHDRPDACFAALDRHIRANLEIVIPTSSIAIPLRQSAPYLHSATLTDERVFGRARWILGIRSTVGPDLVARVPALVKVCSAMFILELVRRAYPGMTLEHLPHPPASIAPRSDTHYFAVTTAGPCWESILSSHEVAAYIPDSYPGASVELLVILES